MKKDKYERKSIVDIFATLQVEIVDDGEETERSEYFVEVDGQRLDIMQILESSVGVKIGIKTELIEEWYNHRYMRFKQRSMPLACLIGRLYI